MSGRYLRKKKPGPRDPTMTHVDDPWLYRVGDLIRSYDGWDLIVAIDDNVFPDTRFAHLRPFDTTAFKDEVLFGMDGSHDFRPLDAENFYENAVSVETGKRPDWSREEARAEYERILAEHATGFVR